MRILVWSSTSGLVLVGGGFCNFDHKSHLQLSLTYVLTHQPSELHCLSSPTVQISIRTQTRKNFQIQATGSSYETHFRVSTFGESHGGGVGCIIDGCPPRIPFTEFAI
ncbi:Chorismate synthase [Arabidopsis thaliana x Arabidopsis arenosa]|uniref:Chorismate synthase n=1 Tax=Arabidopsis thaliana x Arabidopsis arenosa TaxID=1240361 RepID=A0A8T1ZQJ0_9BRAS|nr:Chorismate synthase [Arabidopsis thaliana x Arabidopsis arenosa]KAG7560968.1 Chorismate synthase [Arabidopsis thaliana x Arabidopsis arenosa]